MSKVLNYLKYEGFKTTGEKVIHLLKRCDAITAFFEASFSDYKGRVEQLRMIELQEELVQEFEKIKFYEHILSKDYINRKDRKLLLGYIGDILVGYVAAECEIEKKIYGLGLFSLSMKEAWIGPVYVRRKYRGRGISPVLIKEMMTILQNDGIIHFYTAINEENLSSQSAFKKNGYRKFGTITVQERRNKKIINGLKLSEKFRELY